MTGTACSQQFTVHACINGRHPEPFCDWCGATLHPAPPARRHGGYTDGRDDFIVFKATMHNTRRICDQCAVPLRDDERLAVQREALSAKVEVLSIAAANIVRDGWSAKERAELFDIKITEPEQLPLTVQRVGEIQIRMHRCSVDCVYPCPVARDECNAPKVQVTILEPFTLHPDVYSELRYSAQSDPYGCKLGYPEPVAALKLRTGKRAVLKDAVRFWGAFGKVARAWGLLGR